MASEKKLAVLIDADNASADIIKPILAEIAKYGIASVKRIYGDWSHGLDKWKAALLPHAIIPVQQFAYTKGKNATDIALIIDAMDLLYSGKFDGFCIISSDSDFTKLACRLRQSGLIVYGFGDKRTPEAFRQSCDKFIYTEKFLPTAKTSSSNQSNKNVNTPSLKQVLKLIEQAIKENTDDSGWANLGPIGNYIYQTHSNFKTSSYGFSKLSDLVKSFKTLEYKTHNKQIQIRCRTPEQSKEKSTSQTTATPTTNTTPATTRAKQALKILQEVITKNVDESGWADFSKVGSYIKQHYPEFNVKDYGFGRLASLVRSLNELEYRAQTNDSHTQIRIRPNQN